MNSLSATDVCVIVVGILAVMVWGLWKSGRQRTVEDYFLAGGRLQWWLVSISMYSNLLTPMSFIGVSGWIFAKDSRWFVGNAIAGALALYFAAALWIPLWSSLRPLSIFEYLERRFHPAVRTFGAVLFLVQMICWLGNLLVSTADVFERLTALPMLGCLGGVLLAATLYTFVGGARADVMSDLAHFCILLFSLAVLAFALLREFHWSPGDLYSAASTRISTTTGHTSTTIFSAEFDLAIEGTFWAILFHRFYGVLTFGTEQLTVQRLLATQGQGGMRRAMWGFVSLDLVVTGISVLVAWGLVASFQRQPEPALEGNPDALMMSYVGKALPSGVRGLVLSGVLAALMASYDTGLNSLSNIVLNDIYRRFFVSGKSERHYLAVSRILTLAFAVAIFFFALWQQQHRNVTALQRVGQYAALFSGPLASAFLLGVLFRRTSTLSAWAGIVAALMFSLTFNGIPSVLRPFVQGVNWIWVAGFSTLAGVALGWIVSFAGRGRSDEELRGLTVWNPAVK